METETIVAPAAEDNQMDLGLPVEGGDTADNTENTEATQETGSEQEFTDTNMQRRWTEKTTELAEQRKAFLAEQESFKSRQAEIQRKLDLYDRIDKDPEIVQFVAKRWGAKEEPAELTDDDYYAAQSDPKKFKELIRREAEKVAQSQMNPLRQDLTAMKTEQEISSYATEKGNEDFWELDEAGLIEPQILLLRQRNPRSSHMELIKMAHQESRRIINSLNDNAQRKAMAKASGIVQVKKAASIDAGSKTSAPVNESYKGKTITEIAEMLKNKK